MEGRTGRARVRRRVRGGTPVAALGALLVLLAGCTSIPDAEPPDGDGLGALGTGAPPPPDAPTDSVTPDAPGGEELSVEEVGARWGPSVYRIDATGCGYSSTGSGWVVDDSHVVTNRHVVAMDPTPTLVSRDGSQLEGTVIGWEESPDIAVIEVAGGGLADPIAWAPAEDLAEGQELVSIGYPAPAGDFSVFGVSIVSFQNLDSVRQAIRADGALDRGNSGGPALTRDGRVAGVVTEMAQNPGGLQLVPLIFTADALRSTVEGIIAAPATVQQACEDTAREVVPEDWDGGDAGGDAEPAPSTAPEEYGDDAELDALYDACADGDMAACDDLYFGSYYGTEYESFGASCGGTGTPAYGTCDREEGVDDPQEELRAQLDAECADGDLASCDTLFWRTPVASDREDWASRCGGRAAVEQRGACRYADEVGEGIDVEAAIDLDVVREDCRSGNLVACDELFWNSPLGSDDEAYGGTCGERNTVSTFGRCRIGAP